MHFIYSFLIFSFVLCGSIIPLEGASSSKISLSNLHRFSNFPEEYQTAINLLQKTPEIKALLTRINLEGGISIEKQDDPDSEFDAYWDGERRVILINAQRNLEVGACICSIVFELHNAKTNKLFLSFVEKAKKGLISKEEYVKNVEQMEYQNALDTVKVIEKGIQRGTFPPTARWNIFYLFDDYYKAQQLLGHSGWLAQSFDRFNCNGCMQSFCGTIPNLHLMTEQDKQDMVRYLSIKNHFYSSSEEDVALAKFRLEEEWRHLETSPKDPRNNIPKSELMQIVFQDNQEFEKIKQSPCASGNWGNNELSEVL